MGVPDFPVCKRQLLGLGAQLVKNLPIMQESQVQSLGGDNPLEKEMAPHSSILACRIPWTEEPHRLQSMGLHRVGHDRNNLEGIHAQIIS